MGVEETGGYTGAFISGGPLGFLPLGSFASRSAPVRAVAAIGACGALLNCMVPVVVGSVEVAGVISTRVSISNRDFLIAKERAVVGSMAGSMGRSMGRPALGDGVAVGGAIWVGGGASLIAASADVPFPGAPMA